MKKLTVSIALLTLLAAGAAFAAEPATAPKDGKPPHKAELAEGKGGKRPHPRFEECDKNNDKTLSFEEFSACFPRDAEKRFASIDTNKDGKITREEMNAFRDARRAEKRRELFKQCDKNNDGVLSFEEFEQCRPAPKGKPGHMPPQ